MKSRSVINLATPKAAAKHEHLFNKADYDRSLDKAPVVS